MPLWVSLALAVRICVPETDEAQGGREAHGRRCSVEYGDRHGRRGRRIPGSIFGNGCERVLVFDTLVVFQENV